jgi:hypothetical protein
MKTKHKLKLLKIILKSASSEEWYTEDVVYCYKKLHKAINK